MDVNVESIPSRIKRLTTLLNKTIVEKRNDANGSCLLSRETLLDALILLYDECNNEFLMKDPLIADFVEKCGYFSYLLSASRLQIFLKLCYLQIEAQYYKFAIYV